MKVVFKVRIFQRRVSCSAFSLKFLMLIFLLAMAGAVSASEIELEALEQRCRTEMLAEIENSLPGIEELSFEDLGDVPKWLSASVEGASFAVVQVGCWNRKNGIVPIQLELNDGGKEVRRWFKIRVNGKERVLLAGRDLVRGEPVQSSDFVSTLVDCQSLRQEVVSFLSEGMIYQLTSNLRVGEPLSSRRLQPYRLIKRGDLVQVFLQQGGVSINTRGVAMENGILKEVITVKNPNSRKYYQAQVVASGEVVVVY